MLPSLITGALRSRSVTPGVYDRYFDKVVALLHMDGANGSTTFTDQKSHTFTAQGNAQVSTAQSKFGGASALFDGNGDYITSPSNDFLLAANSPFCIEFWFRLASTSGTQVPICMGNATNYWQMIMGNGVVRLNRAIGGAADDDFNVSKSLDTSWHFMRWNSDGSTNTVLYDGTVLGSWSRSDWSFVTANTLYIGANFNGGTTSVNGNIDEFRYTKASRGSAAFPVPDRAFPDQ